MTRRARRGLNVALSAAFLVACSSAGSDAGDGNGGDLAARSDRCIVRLHGKGESGTAPVVVDGVAILTPDGNGSGWGGRQWEYAEPEALTAARDRIDNAADGAGCTSVVVHGFSNGASMAAALYCSGDDLDGRLAGVVVDDPVTDSATVECAPVDVPITLYWTGALDDTAPPGTDCLTVDWTCAGDRIRGIDVYAADLGVAPTASPFDDHRWYVDSPVPFSWLD